jgi:hypothetical protein
MHESMCDSYTDTVTMETYATVKGGVYVECPPLRGLILCEMAEKIVHGCELEYLNKVNQT